MIKKSPSKLPLGKFFGKYAPLLEQAFADERRQRPGNLLAAGSEDQPRRMITFGRDWEDVAEWWPIVVLRQAAEEGDSEGCKRLLSLFLLELRVRLPKGVLIPFRWNRGRPNETERIYEAWVAKGRPATSWRVCDDLARAFYADEFAQAKSNSSLRKKLRDRVRGTILRHQAMAAATKSAPIS